MRIQPQQMSGRQRLEASLTGGRPDRIPWAPLIDPYYLASLTTDFQQKYFHLSTNQSDMISQPLYLADQWRLRVIDFTRFIHADILGRHAPGLKVNIEDVNLEQTQEQQKLIRRHVTSVGVLTDIVYSVPQSPGYPFYGAEYKLKSLMDLHIYRHIWENIHFEPDYQAFLAEEAYIADDGIAAIDGLQSAVQLLLGEEAGVNNFYYLLQDYRSEMEALIEAMHTRIRQAYEVIARSPTKVVIAMEDLSSTTSSPAIFERYSWRHLNEYADILHSRGKIFLAHMCGWLKAMAPLIANSKLDGVESLTTPSIGDLTIAEAREKWGNSFIIVGGLNANVMLETDRNKVRLAVLDAFEQAAPGSHFVLSNSDAMPYGVSLETLQTVAKVVEQHGAFPLSSDS